MSYKTISQVIAESSGVDPTGDSQFLYGPEGLTASLNQMAQYINNVYNVKHYGAKGNGSADDYAAVQNCINDCIANGGGTVYFPPGQYLTDTTNWLIVASGVLLRGAGWGATELVLGDEINREIIVVGDASTACNNVSFMDFTLEGNKQNQTSSESYVGGTRNLLRYRSDGQNCYGGIVKGVQAKNGKQNGISSESHSFVSIETCIAEECDQFGIWFENGANMSISRNWTRNNVYAGIKGLSAGATVVGNESKGDVGGGIILQSVGGILSNNHAYRTGWQGATTTASPGIQVSLTDAIAIVSNRVYGSYGHGMILNGVVNSSIMANVFRRNGQQTNDTYSDMYLTNESGGGNLENNEFIGNNFMNDTAAYFGNKTKYNISANNDTSHLGNTFDNNSFGDPVTAKIHNLASTSTSPEANDNSFGFNQNLNPKKYYSYGYLDATQTIDPADGNELSGSGYESTSTVTIQGGLFKGQRFSFIFRQDVGNKLITWSNVTWLGGNTPVLSTGAGEMDAFDFVWDGSAWIGNMKPNGS